jgi:radical SAM protein with 4Fe4S-binding SPASM domain
MSTELSKKYIKKLLYIYQSYFLGLFISVNLETFGRCNRKCSCCFNSDAFLDRDVGAMDEKIYNKVIGELSEMNYAGRLSTHYYGEPLLDERIVDLTGYAREKCPYAYLMFGSNGDFLTDALLVELIRAGLDRILVTNYNETSNDSLVNLARKYPSYMTYRELKDLKITNRAGRLYNKDNKKIDDPCLRPSRQLTINWKGNVLLCCNDYYEDHLLGNVMDRPLIEIWNDRFKGYRKVLSKRGGRREIDICKNCDDTWKRWPWIRKWLFRI